MSLKLKKLHIEWAIRISQVLFKNYNFQLVVYCHFIPFIVFIIFRICRYTQWDHYKLQRFKEVFGKCTIKELFKNVSIISQ